jgi:hypothetical protein
MSGDETETAGAPRPWSLEGEDAPEPQTEDPTVTDAEPDETGAATHTGTDPYGRAIGPAEDHTEPKLDSEGRDAKGRTADDTGTGVDPEDDTDTDDTGGNRDE